MKDRFTTYDDETELVFGLDPVAAADAAEAPAEDVAAAEHVLDTLLGAAETATQEPVTITEFDPLKEVLAITLPEHLQDARVETRPTRDRRGTDVLLNGWRMATVEGVTGLAPSDIEQIIL